MKRSFFKLVTNEIIDNEEKEDEFNNIIINKNSINNFSLKNKKIYLDSISSSNDTNNNNETTNNNNNESNNTNSKNIYSPAGDLTLIPNINGTKTYQNNIFIIQKYIEKPLCYNGRKCDMRLWVLLTWNFHLFLFKEGHFKASSLSYDVNSQDLYVHLTNYSVQKHNENFQKFEIGNEISFKDFEKSFNNDINIKRDLLPKIKEIIICSMKSVSKKVNKFDRKGCFEIFGYDFIFDENFVPYLLEVNTNPGLEISSPLMEMLIPRMIDDAFKLTIDKICLLKRENIEKIKENPYKVNGYDDKENMWELLCNININ